MSLSDLRERLQDNPKVYYGTIAVSLVIGLAMVARWLMVPPTSGVIQPPVTEVFFYDLNTEKLYSIAVGTQPPAQAPSGADAGVRAHVFACGDCSDVTKQFTAYLQSRIPYKPSMLDRGRKKPRLDSPNGLVDVVRARGETEWVMISSKHGRKLIGRAQQRCVDQIPAELKAPILKNDDPDPDLSSWRLIRCQPQPKQ